MHRHGLVIAHCTDSEDFPIRILLEAVTAGVFISSNVLSTRMKTYDDVISSSPVDAVAVCDVLLPALPSISQMLRPADSPIVHHAGELIYAENPEYSTFSNKSTFSLPANSNHCQNQPSSSPSSPEQLQQPKQLRCVICSNRVDSVLSHGVTRTIQPW